MLASLHSLGSRENILKRHPPRLTPMTARTPHIAGSGELHRVQTWPEQSYSALGSAGRQSLEGGRGSSFQTPGRAKFQTPVSPLFAGIAQIYGADFRKRIIGVRNPGRLPPARASRGADIMSDLKAPRGAR